MEKRADPSPPSAASLGYYVIQKLFQKSCSASGAEVIAERVFAIVESETFSAMGAFFDIAFTHLQARAITEAQRTVILGSITKVARIVGRTARYRAQVIQFFDDTKIFPGQLLEALEVDAGVRLAVYAAFTHHAPAAKALLKGLLEKMDKSEREKLPEDVLYDIRELDMDAEVGAASTCGAGESVAVVGVESAPSLYDIVIESDSRSLTSPAHLKRLFDFFGGFNEAHAAEFVTALSSQNCCFRAYFAKLEETQKDRILTLFRDSFEERNVDFAKIGPALDIVGAAPLDNEGCALLFTLLQGLLKDQRSSFLPFAKPWRNEAAQVKFIWYLANNVVPSMNMESDCRMCQLGDYQAPSGIPNNCWLCLDYVECTLRLAERFPRDFISVYKGAVEKYNVVIVMAFSQIENPRTETFTTICENMMMLLIQNRQAIQSFDGIWQQNPAFARWLYTIFYTQAPNKISTILDAVGSHLLELLESENTDFVIDIAFQASNKGLLSIAEFIKKLYEKHSESVIVTILEFVKKRVLDSNMTSPALLSSTINSMFEYFWTIFQTLSPETKLLINTVYSICDSSVPSIKRIPFVESLPAISSVDSKETASEYFQKFIAGDMSVAQFVQLFHQLRVSEQALFRSMEQYVIMELNYINKQNDEGVEKLGQLVGTMMHENLFSEDQLKQVFETFVKAYHTSVNSQEYKFTACALEICWAKLAALPQYVFKILKEPLFKSSQPQLYEKLRKLSSNLATPVRHAKTANVTLHPKLRRFEKLPIPPPRICRLIQQIRTDPTLISTLSRYSEYLDWLALHLVTVIQDHPTELPSLLAQLLQTPSFTRIVFEAAIFESIQLIKSDNLATYEGGFARRRLSILGGLLGELTLARNRTIPGRFLDLKQLLLFSFMQGKLLGVIPFVSAIVCKASPYFNPPNPYMSSILQVLASIGMTDLLKFHIKNQIEHILDHFHVNPSQLELMSLVPDLRQNNFDFVAAPFSLSYVLSPVDRDRIIQFDDNVFSALAATNIVIPDPPPGAKQTREVMRAEITNAALNFLKSEGTALSKVAAATASELIQKDFVYCTNPSIMFETAATLTKQLASGLTLFTVCQKLQRFVTLQMQRTFTKDDAEWIGMTIQANYSWISQMLQDVVHLKARKQVQQKLESAEELKHNQGARYLESVNRQRSGLRSLPPMLQPVESGLTPQHQVIYQDLAQLPLSPAEIVMPDMTAERMIRPNQSFDKYCTQITNGISAESAQMAESFPEDSVLLDNCPVVNPTYEEFLSVIRVMMKYMAKINHVRNDKIYGDLLHRIVQGVPQAFVTRAREHVIQWLRNSIPSVALLCVFLDVKLITTTQLDRFFFDGLNRQPFNCRLFVFAIRFLHETLVKAKTIQPSDMISSLSLVVSIPLAILEQSNGQQQEFYDDLRRVLAEMDVPLNVLSPDSKLETLPTFDANDGVANADSLIAIFNKFAELGAQDENREAMINLAKEGCSHGKDFFVVAFFNGKIEDVKKLIECLKATGCVKTSWSDIAAAITVCIKGNAMVLKMDMTKYYQAMEALLSAIHDDADMLIRYSTLLHELRPLHAPTYAFPWIELATDSRFISGLVAPGSPDGWDAMVTIVCDFICAVTYTCEMNPSTVFQRLYQAFLRFIVILCHDYPDFVASSAPELVILIPSNFTQLHNIILSATPSTVSVTPVEVAIKSIDDVPGIDTFVPSQQPLKSLTEELHFADVANKEHVFSALATQLARRCSTGVIASFVIYITNQQLHGLSLKQTTAESTHIYFVLVNLIENLEKNPEATSVLVNVMVDQLTYQSRTTLFFFKALLTLFKSSHEVSPGFGLNELILRTVLERIMTPPPRPWGLELFIRELFVDPEINLWDRPFVKGSEPVKKLLTQLTQKLQIPVDRK